MSALIAIIRFVEFIVSIVLRRRNDNKASRQRELESDSIAYDKLRKATRARHKNSLSRRSTNGTARDKPAPDKLRPDKYQRD